MEVILHLHLSSMAETLSKQVSVEMLFSGSISYGVYIFIVCIIAYTKLALCCRHPNTACEVLTADVYAIIDKLTNNEVFLCLLLMC